MALDPSALLTLLWGTLALRPYVIAFLLAYAVIAARDLGRWRTLGFFLWSGGVAFATEYSSTRVGVPFGFYHYTGVTLGRELYLADVPLFDPLSFVFLAYASFSLARWALDADGGPRPVLFGGALMMVLDIVIDPLAVRGDRWFLGRIFEYPSGGAYFGVPMSNFVGWAVVGWVIMGGYAWAVRRRGPASGRSGRSAGLGALLYYGVLAFNVTMTFWIGEWALLTAGILVHAAAYLVLYAVSVGPPRWWLQARASVAGASAVSGEEGVPSQ